MLYNEDDIVCPVFIPNALVFGHRNSVTAEDKSKNINDKTMRKTQNYLVKTTPNLVMVS